ncbi:uncharacterized protein BDZ99DRAFT_432159 [Mytilinidion resinicola]|uniref:DUF676 domain-containing protein n=1 Tax=Mytilinidion resinicola TaxID=574789 RepID=A0A6A6ZBV4_9PEZI|nr:uncharacterized protein BDZ99DRAFT_432159 [Mytilinidion resinicola]KAF2817794.1 hypothetical protein BDZ99DRAFT_432159 [Mytilinidion resinicola]
MKKTLLLCFIHGFKGGDDTFGNFPSHLKAILQHALPKVEVLAITYPKFETRGDLKECVARFKEWLQNKVIDLEVASSTPSPTVDPSVHTILIGHSMGGIVAAETLLSITREQPIHSPSASMSNTTTTSDSTPSLPSASTLMFPYIAALLAFDTPYLGISPGVVAHGAEGHWNTAKTAASWYSSLSSAFTSAAPEKSAVEASKMLPAAPSAAAEDATVDVAAAPLWQRYGRVALFAGAAGAVAAGGAAAYLKRADLSSGWQWVGSHLEFVGALARGAELEARLAAIVKLNEQQHVGFANIYTALGRAAEPAPAPAPAAGSSSYAKQISGPSRTFCNLPKRDLELGRFFVKSVNDRARDEAGAHMGMFEPRNNPGYYGMSERAKELVSGWVLGGGWYEEATGGGRGVALEEEEEGVVVDLEEDGGEGGDGEGFVDLKGSV